MPSAHAYNLVSGKTRYIARWVDGGGNRRSQRGFTSRKKAIEFAEEAQAAGRRIKHGLETPAQQKSRKQALRPIAEHVKEYIEATQTQSTSRHITQIRSAIEAAIDACGWSSIADISADALQKHFSRRHREEKIGPSTLNHHRTYLRSFTAWLARHGRLVVDPLAAFKRYDTAADVRRVRRAFTGAEFSALLRTADEPRRMLYLLMVWTGLRVGEVRSLRRDSFDWEADGGPLVIVEAAYSKRRRREEQPIPVEIAATLRPFIESHPARRPVWSLPHDPAAMLRRDLKAAKIAHEDEQGRTLDMHSLRHTFITRLASSGLPVKAAQVLARHSTVTLTMDTYAHLEPDAARAGLERAQCAHRHDAKQADLIGQDQTSQDEEEGAKAAELPQNGGNQGNGQGRIRTSEGVSHQIYSLVGKSDPSTVSDDGCASTEKESAHHARTEKTRGAERRHPLGLPPARQVIDDMAKKIADLAHHRGTESTEQAGGGA